MVGTATATRNAVNRRQADKNAQAYASAMNNVQSAPPPPQEQYAPPAAMPAMEEDMIAKLERLGALYAQGLLTDEEFAAAKEKALAY